MAWTKSEFAKERGAGKKLLSAAYKEYLGRLVPEEYRVMLKLPEGSTWSDAVAIQNLKRAVGLITKDQICYTAITELREVTEGKIAEKIVATGNEELLALAAAIQGPPAPKDQE